MYPTNKTARVAGALYILNGAAALFSYRVVPNMLIVQGNATMTANHVLASELLFRASIVSELFNAVTSMLLALTLYRLLHAVNKMQVALMVAFLVVAASMMCLIVLSELAALALFHDAGFLSAFQKAQLDAQAMLFLQVHDQGLLLANIFWGLWLVPFGALVRRSGFFPRILGVLLIAACCGYVARSLTLLLPNDAPLVNLMGIMYPILGAAGEGTMQFWLLIRGAKLPRLAAVAA